MTRSPFSVLWLLAALITVGCTEQAAPADDASASPATEPEGASIAGSNSFEIAVGEGEAEAFAIVPGSFLTGSFTVPKKSSISSVGVQIGNYGGSADGRLTIEVCQEGQCSIGSAEIAGTVDNETLEVPLAPRLEAAANAVLRFRIVKTEGKSPVAIWLFPPANGSQVAMANGDHPTKGVPRLTVRY